MKSRRRLYGIFSICTYKVWGSKRIANALNERGIIAPTGGKWHKRTIMDMLKNEKYIGDLLLQKTYTENHITKRRMVNRGELAQYYVQEHHEPIVDRETFDKVQRMIADKEEKNPTVAAYDYNFKGMVFCGVCGSKYGKRKTHGGTIYERYIWLCQKYSDKGKEACPSKQIPDTVLCELAAGFDKEIDKIIIYLGGVVKFMFADGSDEIKKWEINRKWSDEMKQRNYENQRRRWR